MPDNTCVCCGAVIPEGRQICYHCEHECNEVYKKLPDGVDFSTEFPTFIIGYCPDYCEWFVTNKRFFFYEHNMEFNSESEGLEYLRSHAKDFYRVQVLITEHIPSFRQNIIYISNTNEEVHADFEEDYTYEGIP